MKKSYISILFFLFISTSFLYSQRINTSFGKNRIQYHIDFDTWNTYESENFMSYFYGEARNVAQYAVLIAEKELYSVEKTLEHRLFDKIEFIIYKDISDLKQSNLGFNEVFVVKNGYTKILGNKVFVYFNGDHNELKKQIKEGIAHVLYQDMMFGGSLNESVQNSVRIVLPPWYEDGITRYTGRGWGIYDNDLLKDYFQGSTKRKSFKDLQYKNPGLAGTSMWYYIRQNFGEYAISNILYLTRINKNLDSGLEYSIGLIERELQEKWFNHFSKIYAHDPPLIEDNNGASVIKIKNKKKLPITNETINPNKQQIAYVLNEKSKVKIYLQNIEDSNRLMILKYGYRNHLQSPDKNYPILKFSPSGQELFVLYEYKDVIKYALIDALNGNIIIEDILPNRYQRVYDIDFLDNQNLVFSAATKGFVDLFKYNINTRGSQQLTNDYYDDLNPKVVNLSGKNGILFTSNRRDSILRKEHPDSMLQDNQYDLFIYDLDTISNELIRVTDSPEDEYAPTAFGLNKITYLNNKGNVVHRNEAEIKREYVETVKRVYFVNQDPIDIPVDSILIDVDTSLIDSTRFVDIFRWKGHSKIKDVYSRNIISQTNTDSSTTVLEKMYLDGQYILRIQDLNKNHHHPLQEGYWHKTPKNDSLTNNLLNESTTGFDIIIETVQEDNIEEEFIQNINNNVPDGNQFQTDFDSENDVEIEIITEEENIVQTELTEAKDKPELAQKEVRFKGHRIIPYFVKFKIDNVNIKMDNQPLFGGLNSADNLNNNSFEFIRPGILFKTDFKDVLEDYHMTLGARFSTALDGVEMFMLFDDLKKRVDKQYAIYRKTKTYPDVLDSGELFNRKLTQVLGYVKYSYPFSIFSSVRASASFRNDNTVTKSVEQITLNTNDINNQRLGAKLEYVFDNTVDVSPNIKNGVRLKASFEFIKGMSISFSDPVSFKFNKGNMGVLSLDARGYQRIGRHAILAVRAAAFSSIGKEKILYHLGGVENELIPNFSTNLFELEDNSIVYNTQVPQMRGFATNIRNGHSAALVNTEIRLPIMKMIFNRKLKSEFLSSLQLITFMDMGTAWKGTNPFTEENPNNTYYLTSPTVDAKVIYFRDPIVIGYGAGVRMDLFGYFIKIDRAWGIETGNVLSPRWHISMDYDF